MDPNMALGSNLGQDLIMASSITALTEGALFLQLLWVGVAKVGTWVLFFPCKILNKDSILDTTYAWFLNNYFYLFS